MKNLFCFNDHIMHLAQGVTPKQHSHLASHIIISLCGDMVWNIDGSEVVCRGICIAPDTVHAALSCEKVLAFLFTSISVYSESIEKKYLGARKYCVIDDATVDSICKAYDESMDAFEADRLILNICGVEQGGYREYDARVNKIIESVENSPCVESDIIKRLSGEVFLSMSRMSHLFKQHTGMTLRSFLAFEKLHKTFHYCVNGISITEACIKAGFDSSSHCSATCMKMFGIKLSDIKKNSD